MTIPRPLRRALLLAATAALTACHVVGHLPPGQAKQILDPPPGHGGTPPGQDRGEY